MENNLSKRYKIFVINMPKSVERWAYVKAQLDSIGIDVERVDGVDVSTLSKENLDKYYSYKKNRKEYPKPLSKGEIGCHISHVNCWEKTIEQNLDFAIILEDDILITQEFSKAIEFLKSNFDKWDFVRIQVESKDRWLWKKEDLEGFSLYEFLRHSGCSWGYVLKREIATRLLNNIIPFGITTDSNMHLYHKYDIEIKSLIPPVIFARPENDSDIQNIFPTKNIKRFYPFSRQIFSIKVYLGKLFYLLQRDGIKLFFKRIVSLRKIKSPLK